MHLPAAPPQQLPNTIVKPFSNTPPLEPHCSHMASESRTFWSDECYHAQDKPLQAKLDAAYATCGFTVRIQLNQMHRAGPLLSLGCSCCRLAAPAVAWLLLMTSITHLRCGFSFIDHFVNHE